MQRLAFSVAATVNGLPVVSTSFTAEGSGLVQVQETIPAAVGEDPGPAADGEATISFPVTVEALQGLFLLAIGGDLTLTTDNTELIALTDGVPVAWSANSTHDNVIAQDIATVDVVNENENTVELYLVAVVDATP